MKKKKRYSNDFESFYKRQFQKPTEIRAVNLDRFLYAAYKTVSMRGNIHESTVVGAIRERFLNSKLRLLPKCEIWRVYAIANHKYTAYLKTVKRTRLIGTKADKRSKKVINR